MIYCWNDLLTGFNLAGVSGPHGYLGGHGGSSNNGYIWIKSKNILHCESIEFYVPATLKLVLGAMRSMCSGGQTVCCVSVFFLLKLFSGSNLIFYDSSRIWEVWEVLILSRFSRFFRVSFSKFS